MSKFGKFEVAAPSSLLSTSCMIAAAVKLLVRLPAGTMSVGLAGTCRAARVAVAGVRADQPSEASAVP